MPRAVGAMLDILGNSAEEYLGVGYHADAGGTPFDGCHRYTIRFAPTRPLDDRALLSNWLPCPDGPFNLAFRTYLPRAEIRDGRWTAPPVRMRDRTQ